MHLTARVALFSVIIGGALGPAAVASGEQAAGVPDADLQVAIRNKDDPGARGTLWLLILECRDGNCAMTSVGLNQCLEGGNRKLRWTPSVSRTETADGQLRVVDLGGVLHVEERQTGLLTDFRATFRIGYRKDSLLVREVASFSGVMIETSPLEKGTVATTQWVPLAGTLHEVPSPCPLSLPGVGGTR